MGQSRGEFFGAGGGGGGLDTDRLADVIKGRFVEGIRERIGQTIREQLSEELRDAGGFSMGLDVERIADEVHERVAERVRERLREGLQLRLGDSLRTAMMDRSGGGGGDFDRIAERVRARTLPTRSTTRIAGRRPREDGRCAAHGTLSRNMGNFPDGIRDGSLRRARA